MKLAYSVAEAATEVGVSQATIRFALQGSYLIGHRIGRRWIIHHQDLDDWIQSLPTDPTA